MHCLERIVIDGSKTEVKEYFKEVRILNNTIILWEHNTESWEFPQTWNWLINTANNGKDQRITGEEIWTMRSMLLSLRINFSTVEGIEEQSRLGEIRRSLGMKKRWWWWEATFTLGRAINYKHNLPQILMSIVNAQSW